MRKAGSCLAAGLLLAPLSGCDMVAGSGGPAANVSGLKASAPMRLEAGGVIGSAPAASSLLAGASAAASAGPASDPGRRTFDGDPRAAAVPAPPPGPVYVGAPAAKDANALVNAPPRPNSLKVSDVPTPKADTLPAVALPAAEANAGPQGAGPVLAAFDAFQKRVYAAAVVPVFSRLAWGAVAPKRPEQRMNPVRLTVHHTQGKYTTTEAETLAAVRGTQEYHMVGRAKEGKYTFPDIGYHFLIDGSGRIVEGVHADALGTHVADGNGGNIGIAMMGDYNKIQPNAAQVESLRRLASFLAVKYRIDPRQPGFLEGHQHFNNTDCPGSNMMSALDSIRASISAETLRLVNLLKPQDGTTFASNADFTPVLVTHPA